MKIAYLILCHKNEQQVNMLLNELLKDDSDCYVHIDKKSSLQNIIKSHRINILPDNKRVDIKWASNTMIRATLNLIEAVINSNKYYDYVCLLSGQDFTIKTSSERIRFFKQNMGCNYIEVLDHKSSMYTRYSRRNNLKYPLWMFNLNKTTRILRKLYILFTGGHYYTFPFMKRKNNSGLNFEYGSQWWCLHFECIMWMYNYIKKEVNVDFFDNSLTPDECFFQSVFMMSPFKKNRKDKLMFLEWSENKNNPRLLLNKDYEMLLRDKKHLFARKFDITIDENIFNRLIEYCKL